MRKRKKKKTQIEIVYENYCNFHLKHFFDPLGLIGAVLITKPLETPVLFGFVYFCIVVLVRIPLFIKRYK